MTLTSATNQRIAIVCQHKRENPDSTFPDDRDLDAEVPGSGELISALGTIVEHYQQHKLRSGGTIGISYCRSHRSFGVHIGNGKHRYGYYTAKEAAAAYDAAALARYGEDAVLNDPDAVDTLELDIRDKLLSTIP
jgi:hypothetical protein